MNKTDIKICNKCSQIKNKNSFYKQKSTKDGFTNYCKNCIKDYNKNYYKNNRDRIIQNTQQWYGNNKEYKKEYDKNYYKNNREYKRKNSKEYYKNNKEHVQQQKNSRLAFNSKLKSRQEIELYEEIKKSANDNLMCKCAYCGGWFEPTLNQIIHRIRSIALHIIKANGQKIIN